MNTASLETAIKSGNIPKLVETFFVLGRITEGETMCTTVPKVAKLIQEQIFRLITEGRLEEASETCTHIMDFAQKDMKDISARADTSERLNEVEATRISKLLDEKLKEVAQNKKPTSDVAAKLP